MDAVKVYENEEYRFSIFQDDDAQNPRTECDHAGVMVCGHGRYNLGDVQLKKSEFEGWDVLKAKIRRENKGAIILPLRLYDHSGISISTTTEYPYNDMWDSMMVGYIYTDKEMMRKMWGEHLPRAWKKKAVEVLQSEVKEYDDYLTGNVYGFKREKKVNHESCQHCGHEAYTEYEEEDSCWGFIGDIETSGILDNLPDSLKAVKEG